MCQKIFKIKKNLCFKKVNKNRHVDTTPKHKQDCRQTYLDISSFHKKFRTWSDKL